MSVIQDNDLVCIQDRTDTLCNNDRCRIFCMCFECFTQGTVCLEVQCRKAVVKNKDFRFLGNRSRDRKSLFLSTGYVGSSLCDRGCVFLRFCLDKLRCLCNFCCFFYFCFLNISLAVTDVGIDRT